MRHRSARPNVRSVKPLAAKFLQALLAAGSVLFSLRPLAALTLDRAGAAVGQWDLKVEGGNKVCRLTLRSEPVHGGYYIGIPAGCRHAIPALGNVIAWGFPGDGRLDFADVYGAPLLYFSTEDGGDLIATGSQGETYRLTFVGGAPPLPGASAGPRGEVAQAVVTTMKPEPARAWPRPADVAGRYAVLREAGRDTGCMVTLDASSKAFLAPACRDQGIVIFDPVGWRIVGGRLTLTARKGHTTQLDLQPDGTWLKDAKGADAKSLTLKKF